MGWRECVGRDSDKYVGVGHALEGANESWEVTVGDGIIIRANYSGGEDENGHRGKAFGGGGCFEVNLVGWLWLGVYNGHLR